VLASGLGGTSSWWAPQLVRFALEFTTLVFDRRGAGRSSRVGVASVEQISSDSVAILDTAGIDRVHLLRHSMGGAIRAAAALGHPYHIASKEAAAAASLGRAAVQGGRLDAILAFDRRAEHRRLDIPVRVLCTKDDILTSTTFPKEWPG
jgi:aminoacrylate hydrolase